MISHRYRVLFDRHRQTGEAALVPFVVVGDPTPDHTPAIVDLLVEGGADAIELGLPFSDPVADGPTIQAAATRALAAGATVTRVWTAISRIRERHPDLPLGLLSYASPVFTRGVERFYGEAAAAGLDSVLVPDLPSAEAAPVLEAAAKLGVDSVLIAPPDASRETLLRVARGATGFVYLTSRAGVTGLSAVVFRDIASRVADLDRLGAPPAMVGFGIGCSDQVRQVVDTGAAGVIVGSATVERSTAALAGAGGGPMDLVRFIADLKAATRHRWRDGATFGQADVPTVV